MILEGIITTLGDDGVNVAAMGPVVSECQSSLRLRPYQSSQTFRNLQRHPEAVFHVVDDVELIALAAIHQLPPPAIVPAQMIIGWVLQNTCRWWELRIKTIDATQPRSDVECEIVHRGRRRDFWGFCRAKHAVIEAAILATRLDFLPHDEISNDLAKLQIIVDKTSGTVEHRAMQRLMRFFEQHDVRCQTAKVGEET